MGRGNRGVMLFREERDRRLFFDTLTDVTARMGWVVHGWVLMGTHYHMLLETPEPNLVEGMHWFGGTFTQRYNLRHDEYGHLFQGRYKAKVIDDGDPSYFSRVADYIHLNPVAAGLLDPDVPDLKSYAWSSFPDYLKAPSRRPEWLETRRVLEAHRITRDTLAGRRAFEAFMDQQVQWVLREKSRKDWARQWRQYDRGWLHGSETFRQRMTEFLLSEQGGAPMAIYDREQRRACDEAAAEHALDAAWAVVGLEAADLAQFRKGDERKLLLAGWLHAHFSVRRKWVAQRLGLGHPSRLAAGIRLYQSPPDQYLPAKQALLRMILPPE